MGGFVKMRENFSPSGNDLGAIRRLGLTPGVMSPNRQVGMESAAQEQARS